MRLADKKNIVADLKKQWKQSEACRCVIQSFKKDRTVIVIKNGEVYEIVEDGFIQKTEPNLTQKECLSLLKKAVQYEFKNSHKLYVSVRQEEEEISNHEPV